MSWLFEFLTWRNSLIICAVFGGLWVAVTILEAVMAKKKNRTPPVVANTGGDLDDRDTSSGAADTGAAAQ